MKLFNKRNFIFLFVILGACFTLFSLVNKSQESAVSLAIKASEIYFSKGDFEAAKVLFDESLSLDDKNIYTYLSYSDMYCSEGDINEAFKIFKSAGDKIEFRYVDLFLLGMYADLLKDRVAAVKYYREAIEKTPEGDMHKIWMLYFIDPDLSLDKFNSIKLPKNNEMITSTINTINEMISESKNKDSMSEVINEFLKGICN